jgi:hypothetical protein
VSRTNLDAPTLAALAAAQVEMFYMLELDFDGGTIYLADLAFDVEWNGNTYQAALGIGTIEPIEETDTQAKGLTLTMAAVNQASIATALTEEIQGRALRLRLAIVDGTTLRVDPGVWAGSMDVMTIEDNGADPVIRVTAENQMIAWQQPSGALFSDPEQKERFPGDRFFEFVAQMSEANVVWPGKEFFKQ